MEFTDIEVECGNPEALDQTLQQLGPAAVIKDSWNGHSCRVRIFGRPGFIIFAIESQGYGKVIDKSVPMS